MKIVSIVDANAQTFRGMRVYAMDGFEINLPRTSDILKHYYQGRWLSQFRQQHGPTMYTVFCLDVLSETIKNFNFSPAQGELDLAEPMIQSLEKNSICIYDRLYPSRRFISAHKKAQNHFIFRLRTNSFKEASRLLEQKIKRRKTIVDGVEVRFIRIKNPRTGEDALFATNLPKYWVDEHTIRSLYNLRWECETTFSDLVRSFQVEQFHSKFLNGILQEIYASLWLYNFTKLQILKTGQITKNPLNWKYQKPNFKFILDWVIKKLPLIFKRLLDPGPLIANLVIKSTATRIRHTKSKPRELKYSLKRYPFNNTVWILPKSWEGLT